MRRLFQRHRQHRFFPQRLIFLLLVSTFPRCVSASPQPIIRGIHFSGTNALREGELRDLVDPKIGSAFIPTVLSSMLHDLADRYRRDGYLLADVALGSLNYSNDSTSVDLNFSIDEGRRFVTGTILIEGNTAFPSDDILSRFETRVGIPPEARTLNTDIDALLSRYDNSGYPFAAVRIARIEPTGTDSVPQLLIALSIDEGSKIRIGEIRIEGNTETSDHVIVREMGITIGELYNADKISRIRFRLNRMNLFASVEEPELYLNQDGAGGLRIKVAEGNTTSFDGVLGYLPSGDGSGDVSGLIDISMRNLLGSARKLNVRWQRDDRLSQETYVKYLEPWFLELPLDVSGAYRQRQQDSTYIFRSIGVDAAVRFAESFTLTGSLTRENVIPSATASFRVDESKSFTSGLELSYDTRTDPVSPTGGVLYKTNYRVGTKSVRRNSSDTASTETSVSIQRITLDADVFVQTSQRQVALVGVHARQLVSDRIGEGDVYRFGGATTLRGYRENQFAGSRVAWMNVEYRFLLARRSFVFGFLDAGYYFLPADDRQLRPELEHGKYGYGLGIRLETSLGNMSVSIALGEGDSFGQAKLHVGLINEF